MNIPLGISKTILISGGTGLIGNHLSEKLIEEGHNVILLSRSAKQSGNIPLSYWNPPENIIDADAVSTADVIIHLAGTNIGAGRWTASRKKSILESRVNTARLLFNSVNRSSKKPGLLISASGVNYYGVHTSEKIHTEEDHAGNDFLSLICVEWEKAACLFESIGIRTIIFRNGLVLSGKGGLLKRLYIPFKAGFGVILGSGKQYMPWIHIDDLCSMVIQSINNESMKGIYNAVAPEHVNFKEFANYFASALNRKIVIPRVPGYLIKLVLGEMSEIILKGSRVSCQKILDTGFHFRYTTLKPALGAIFRTQQ